MDVSEVIRTKRAIREFTDRPIPEEAVRAILNAGRRAQSSKNSQPWRFIVIREKARLKALSEMGTFAGHLAGAAVGVAILTRPPEERWSVMFDAGQAAAYMQLAAWELGIGSCMATIYEPEKARKLLGFPDDVHIRAAISFGYPIPGQARPATPKKGGRRGFHEVVHWETW